MPSARTDSRSSTPLAAVVLLGTLALVALLAAGCGGGEATAAPVVAPGDVHLAGAAPEAMVAETPAPGASGVAGRWTGVRDSADADRLEAARTVALYCHLVEAGQFARAGELCASRRLWSRRALGGLRRFHFRSARVFAVPDTRTLVLKARVRVHARRGCPLPDGLAVVFFALGRVGSAVGGWLITAVSTSL
jgi:hypothetical protein